jgi:hypothetical protein
MVDLNPIDKRFERDHKDMQDLSMSIPWDSASVAILWAKDSEVPVLEPYRTYKGFLLASTLTTLGATTCSAIPVLRAVNNPDDGGAYNRAGLDRGTARI